MPTRDLSVSALFSLAYSLHSESRQGGSARAFARARALAEQGGRQDEVVRMRFWEGTALHCAGHFTEALSTLAPLLASGSITDADWGYMALGRYLLIAVDLPLPLSKLDRALREASDQIEASRGPYRQSRLLLVRARLERSRGRRRAALGLAQESLVHRRREGLAFTFTSHYRSIVAITNELGDHDLSRYYLEEWERVADNHGTYKRLMIAALWSDLLLREGSVGRAVDWVRRLPQIAPLCDDLACQYVAASAQVRCWVRTNEPWRAREPLGSLLRLRACGAGGLRYGVHLLLGDYHLAIARQAMGLPVIDPTTGAEMPVERIPGCTFSACRSVHRARRAYRWAGGIGETLDTILECDWRRREVRARLDLVDDGTR